MHRRYQCPFCPVSMIDVFYNGPAALHGHVTQNHYGKTVHHCNDCNSVFSSEANFRRHVAIVHNKQCVYCDETDAGHGGDRYERLPKFPTVQQLQQHVATTHNQHVCTFYGDMFTSGEGLHRHQMDHCQRGYTCTSCDSTFDSLTQCQYHMASHVSRMGSVLLIVHDAITEDACIVMAQIDVSPKAMGA